MGFALGPRAQSAQYRLVSFDTLNSTNAEALTRVRAGEQGPLWLATAHQTAGHGRRQRAWISPPGNLACSVVETLTTDHAGAATLGFAAGLALETALRKVSNEAASFRLKWPNDVLAGGKKLAGILIEAEATPDGLAAVVGMGVNVVAAPEGTPYPATSLNAQGIVTDAAALFAALTDAWAEWFALWDHGRGFETIRTQWLVRAAGLGAAIQVRQGERVIDGVFETIDEAGRLVVSHDGGSTKVAAGDVYFGAAMSAGAA
ncbi:biotin--[acetyl-CoA-carboxylase] ligase [[Pseudomonas] carboxydohydrogena]|uniref:biotin--[biotin carboxyl-carrier protein] ligase n=1 Tax=Afipia carboxydohydrogena TaxID=290 RepID=A0ABY8BUP9_AFICR|nr:biotin--[acetyl-CoA-carboxylase] ligase [[Pseudomonas] carboxydohydrogena]WEF53041.1 biotin--[acetyl-CoA-carboxylase] ligase [[Pseudomonas] carboxydohydrogena]